MVPVGVSPVESAFEVMGLINAKAIIDFLFKEKGFGQAFFAIGLIAVIWKVLKEEDISSAVRYLFTSIILAFLFVNPVRSLGGVTSEMEAMGWKDRSTKEVLEDKFVEKDKVAQGSTLGLVMISQGMSALVSGTINAITKISSNEEFNYLKNPFIVNKVSMYLKSFTEKGITEDKKLSGEAGRFLHDCYSYTIKIMAREKGAEGVTKKWWPGDKDVVARYCDKCEFKCKQKWLGDPEGENEEEKLGIDKRLDLYIEKYNKKELSILYTIFPKFPKTTLKIKLLKPELEKSSIDIARNINVLGLDYNKLKAEQGFPIVGEWLAMGGAFLARPFTESMAQGTLKTLPYIEGYGVLFAYSLFPFTVMLYFIHRKTEIFLEYFMYLFWIKSFPISWAIVHYASIYMTELQARMAGGSSGAWFLERPFFDNVTAVMTIMSPVISLFFIKGVISGIGEASSASTMQTEKGLGKIKVGKVGM